MMCQRTPRKLIPNMKNDGQMAMRDAISKDLNDLANRASTAEGQIAPATLLSMADCFLLKSEHLSADVALFEEFARHTLHECDDTQLCILAEKLCPHAQTPRWIIEYLKTSGGTASAALIRHRAELSHDECLAFAQTGSVAEAAAVAGRGDLTSEIVSSLMDRAQRMVFLALAWNNKAPVDRRHFLTLVRAARMDRELAHALLSRPHEGEDVGPLFLSASPQERTRIILAVRRASLGKPHVNVLAPRQDAFIKKLETLAIAKDWHGFAVELAGWLGCTLSDAVAIVEDPFGEPLAVALAACGAKADSAGLVFLSRPDDISQSVELVHGLTQLTASLSQKEADRLMTFMLDLTSVRAKRSGHMPVYDATAANVPSRPVIRARRMSLGQDAEIINKKKV